MQAALKERDLPPDLHKRVLAYFSYSYQRVGGDAENELWQQLPYELRVCACTSIVDWNACLVAAALVSCAVSIPVEACAPLDNDIAESWL